MCHSDGREPLQGAPFPHTWLRFSRLSLGPLWLLLHGNPFGKGLQTWDWLHLLVQSGPELCLSCTSFISSVCPAQHDLAGRAEKPKLQSLGTVTGGILGAVDEAEFQQLGRYPVHN